MICTDGVGEQRRDRLGNRIRIDERLVALHVDDDVAVERGGDFGEPIGRAVMIGARHADLAAELLHRAGDAEIVGRDDHLRDRRRRRRAPVDVLDHRAAVDQRERLAGKSGRGESGGDECDDVECRDRIESMITRAITRARVHDE